ncbi:MAG: DMT family transporter [Proteobacteria bacterium]|nr:DMT family transporter [Pseudomonadota bacterium]
MMHSAHTRSLLLVLSAGVLWSTVGLGIRLIQDADVWQILLYRSISLSIFLYIVIYIRSRVSPFQQIIHAGLPGVIAGLSLVGAYAGGIYAIQHTSVANAMLLFAAAPFLAAILGWAVIGERVYKGTWISICFAMLGIAIMVGNQTFDSSLNGSLAALGSALGFAAFTVTLRWGKEAEMLPSVFLSGIFGVVITAMICTGLGLSFVISAQDSGISIGMGIFQVGAGLVLYTLGSKSLPAVELTLMSLGEVLLAPLWVWLLLGETVTSNILAGGCILLGAIAGNAIFGSRTRPRALL